MKFSLSKTFVFLVLTAFTNSILCRTSVHERRSSFEIIQARQAKLKRVVASSDTCASLINKPLAVTDSIGLPPVTIGHINTCLCISGITNFMATNVVAQAAVAVASTAAARAALVNLIETDPSSKTCTYPDVASPVCSTSNVCGFTCPFPYTLTTPLYQSPDCSCLAPNTLCNGVCGSFPNGCSSAAPAAPTVVKRRNNRKRSLDWDISGLCPEDQDVCGVFGGKGWECIDIERDRQSCGGCMIPSPFSMASSPASELPGKDCTAIPNVDVVACVSSSCYVRSCKDGYTPSSTRDSCVAHLETSDEDILVASNRLVMNANAL
ncbi:Protein PriA/CPL1 [Abortiporus biennis]